VINSVFFLFCLLFRFATYKNGKYHGTTTAQFFFEKMAVQTMTSFTLVIALLYTQVIPWVVADETLSKIDAQPLFDTTSSLPSYQELYAQVLYPPEPSSPSFAIFSDGTPNFLFTFAGV
jgi:hypothetical protein